MSPFTDIIYYRDMFCQGVFLPWKKNFCKNRVFFFYGRKISAVGRGGLKYSGECGKVWEWIKIVRMS